MELVNAENLLHDLRIACPGSWPSVIGYNGLVFLKENEGVRGVAIRPRVDVVVMFPGFPFVSRNANRYRRGKRADQYRVVNSAFRSGPYAPRKHPANRSRWAASYFCGFGSAASMTGAAN